ncbi:MAG: HNH endonuclease [Streptosporangiaceae bacterium]
MPVSEQTRKILWITAGGRCSICRDQLATSGTDSDAPSAFGEEAHIVARSPGGPRAGQVTDPDGYHNLILLCSKDHKRVDDQESFYTVEHLKAIKIAHEIWTKTQGEHVQYRPRPVPTPAPQPAMAGGPVAGLGGISRNDLFWFGAIMLLGLACCALILHHGLLRMGTLA